LLEKKKTANSQLKKEKVQQKENFDHQRGKSLQRIVS